MKNNTTFVRVEKNRNYTTIHNEFLKRKDLSWKAKGIMTYLLSLPDDWVVNLDEIKRNATDGESSFRSGWKELVSAGYVSRQPVRDDKTKKIMSWETVIKEMPDEQKSHNVENHNVGNHQVGNHQVGNRKLLSTKELSTDKQSIKQQRQSELKELNDFYENLFGTYNPNVTIRFEDLLEKGFESEVIKRAYTTAKDNARNPNKYVNKIFDIWIKEGLKSVEDIDAHEEKRQSRKKVSGSLNYLDEL